MTLRAHLYRPLQNGAGNLQTGATVRVIDPATGVNTTLPVYVHATGTDTYALPISVPDGILDFYLDLPQRVNLGVTTPTLAEVIFNDVDVILPVDLSTPGFRTSVGNYSVVGGDLDTPAFAYGNDSLAIGSGSIAGDAAYASDNDRNVQTVADGPYAKALGNQAQAIGNNAVAHGFQALAIGKGALAGDTALDAVATANNQVMAIGNSADAEGAQAMAMGNTASAYGTQGLAIGNSSSATSHGGVAIGNSATAGEGYQKSFADTVGQSVAIGTNTEAHGTADTAVGADAISQVGGSDNTLLGAYAIAKTPTNTFVVGGTALGSNSGVQADYSVAVGYQSFASGANSVTMGNAATTDSANAVAIGDSATINAVQAVAVGSGTVVGNISGIAIGHQAEVHADRAMAFGEGVVNSTADTAKMATDSLELLPSSGGPQSGMILHDSAGARWRITVDTTGHLTATSL